MFRSYFICTYHRCLPNIQNLAIVGTPLSAIKYYILVEAVRTPNNALQQRPEGAGPPKTTRLEADKKAATICHRAAFQKDHPLANIADRKRSPLAIFKRRPFSTTVSDNQHTRLTAQRGLFLYLCIIVCCNRDKTVNISCSLHNRRSNRPR